MKMEHPELLQAYRSNRNRVNAGYVIACIIFAALIVMIAASTAHAGTYQELQERYQKVEVGIAPPESNTSNALNAMEFVENPYQTIQMTDAEYNELLWVLALAAQTEGQSGMECCCEVVFNRVLSNNNWGGTVHGVLAKRGQFVEYKYIGKKSAWAHPGETEKAAVAAVIANGPTHLPDMRYVYFDTGKKNGSRNIRIGNHWFGAEK